MPKKQSAGEWLIGVMQSEPGQVKRKLAQLKKGSMRRYRIEHGIEVMAVSMGIKRIAHVAPERLYLWSVKRYTKESRRYGTYPWPLENLFRVQLFYFGRDIVLKELKG